VTRTVRRHIGDTLISALFQLGAFSGPVVVSEMQTVPIDKNIPESGPFVAPGQRSHRRGQLGSVHDMLLWRRNRLSPEGRTSI
jgi:hypothetical protein